MLHLSSEPDFQPARRAHPCLLLDDLEAMRQRLLTAGIRMVPDEAVPGVHRFYGFDPFGNRIEFIQEGEGFSQTAASTFHEPHAVTSEDVRNRHQDNRQAWNEAAQHYRNELDETILFLRRGGSNLHPVERRNLEGYRGKLATWCHTAIHLQCASGRDTLSLWNEGAREVIGVDISDVHIENARQLSAALNAPARWFACDVLETPHELDGSADLVYTGRGALCWLHDLDAWGRVVARLLKPGGIFHVFDDHPASWLFDQDAPGLVGSGINYFGHSERNQGWPATYINDLEIPAEQMAYKHERLWTLAEVFNAVHAAGLIIELLGEHPEPYWDAFPNLPVELQRRMPTSFSVLARRP